MMKTTQTTLKTSLVGLFLMATLGVMAQTTGTIEKPPLNLGPVNTSFDDVSRVNILTADLGSFNATYEETNAVLFYNPATSGPSMTLTASLTEDHTERTGTDALKFTQYRWYYMGQDGSEAVAGHGLIATGTDKVAGVDTDANQHQVTQLEPGFHYFKVEGYIVPEGLDIDDELCTVQEETFIVFVLPELTTTVAHTGGDTSLLQYCENEADAQTNVVLTASAAYDTYTGEPASDQFDLKYTWYAVKSNDVFSADNGDFPTIDASKTDISGAIQQTAATATFTPDISEIGAYKFFVEVEYTVKDRNYDSTGAEDPTARKRPYAIYRGWFGGNTQDDATVVYVTPAPGKPHITIEAVID